MATGDPMTGRGEQVTNTPAHPSTPTGVTGNPPRLPESSTSPPAAGAFKQSQMLLAVAVLIVVVFVVTFAMNYLGGGAKPTDSTESTKPPPRQLTFAWKSFPPDGVNSIEREHRTRGHFDFWFTNANDTPLKVGLQKENCKCSEVHLFYLPEDGPRRVLSDAVAFLGVAATATLPLTGAAGIAPVVGLKALAAPLVEQGASEHKILRDKEAVDVPAKTMGWIRLGFKGERPGPIALQAIIWTEHRETGGKAALESKVVFHEALRVLPILQVGTLKEAELANGHTRYITCWSSMRSHLNLEAKAAFVRGGGPKGDPFQVGKPIPLKLDEMVRLQQEILNAAENDPLGIGGPPGQVMSAYRIPVTLRALSEDGTRPFDIGPFRRRVVISAPEVDEDPKSVVVMGKVLGLIELGTTDEEGEVNFRVFSSKQGKRERITLSTEVKGLDLKVDETRTSAFLRTKLEPLSTDSTGPLRWRLTIEVLPGKAMGVFPRKDDPAFEDCAVYLTAKVEGEKHTRPIRIGVGGTAGS